ncbi:MAG: hypothetical protein RR034_03810 [Bacteroidales bacterium]
MSTFQENPEVLNQNPSRYDSEAFARKLHRNWSEKRRGKKDKYNLPVAIVILLFILFIAIYSLFKLPAALISNWLIIIWGCALLATLYYLYKCIKIRKK